MKKLLLILIAFLSVTAFSQDRKGTIFYSTVDKTETEYTINIDIFDLHKTTYIEIEIIDQEDIKQNSKLVSLVTKDNKYFLVENEQEKEVYLEDITITLDNPNNDLEYPTVKVKLLNADYEVIDFSKKIFY